MCIKHSKFKLINKCGTNYYKINRNNIVKNDKTEPIDTSMNHLGACQSIMYKSIPLPPKMNLINKLFYFFILFY